MENSYKHRRNLSQDIEKGNNSKNKSKRTDQVTSDEKESYNKGGNKQNKHNIGDFYTDSHTESQEEVQDSDARRKGELNHAIFVKLQEISKYNIDIGNYEEGLTNYDRCIEHLIRTLPDGHTSAVFQDFLHRTVKSLNEVALKLLQEGKVKESLLLLERCRKMTHPNSFGPYPTLRSLTYNHLGCCYRRIGKLDKALYYLEKAWEFIQGIEKVETAGITHINLCAVLSQLGDHRRALEHAKMAVSDCAYDLIESTKKNATQDGDIDINKKATMLAIAYHNLATEEEACSNAEAALQAYLRAANLMREHHHPQHELCVKFGKAYDEAKVRLNKPGFRRTASPGNQMRRYGTSPPKVTVKRPPSFNTAGKAAKAYLHNNKVIIPARKKTNPANRPMTSHLLSPNAAAQIQNQKLFLPGTRGTNRNDRPVTAHPQSRTQHYQIRGLDESPKNGNIDSERGRDDEVRGSHSEAESEIERLGLNDEDLEKADLKQNRLAFLENLNQYNNQLNNQQEKNNPALKNNFMAEEKQEDSRPRNNTKEQKQKELDPIKVRHAVLKLQSFCRGNQVRQEIARILNETPQSIQPVYLVLIAETMKGNLENGPVMKETLYYFLMMYELNSQLIHIHIKNLENKKFHKALVEYQVVNRTSKEAIIDELREACEKLIQHLEIHQEQIVFRDDIGEEEEGHPEDLYMMGQEMARREPENVITEITERTDERTDESEGRPAGSRQGEEEIYSDREIKKNQSEPNINEEDVPDEAVVDEIAEEDNKYEEEPHESEEYEKHEKREKTEEKKSSPMKENKEEEVYEEEAFEEDVKDEKESKKEKEEPIEVEEPEQQEEEEDTKPNVDSNDVVGLVGLRLFGNRSKKEVEDAATTIQKHIKGKLARDKYKLYKQRKFKVVFSRCTNIQGDIIGLRLVENIESKETSSSYDLCCYNFTKSKQFKTIDFPKSLVNLSVLAVEQLVSLLNIDTWNTKVEIREDVKNKKHTEEIPEEENEEFLASVPLFFGKEKLDSTIHYDKKGDKILVKHGFERNHPKTLEVDVRDLDMDSKFSKKEFVNNLDIVLLSKLNYKDGGLIYEKSPIADSIFYKKDKTEEPKGKVIEEDPLPDLNDPDVKNAALVIQNAYKKKNKNKEKEQEKREKNFAPNQRYSEKALEEIDTQNLRENRGPVESTKSGFLYVNQEAEELHHGKIDQFSPKNLNSSYEDSNRLKNSDNIDTFPRLASPKEEIGDELPNLNDPDVQRAGLTIQNAYKKRQNKEKEKIQQREKEEREREEKERQEKEKKSWKEDKEELPDLEDPEVQQATYKIQKVYKKKTMKKNKKEEESHEQKERTNQKDEDELPNLNDPEVQNATFKIQQAYKKKTMKKNKHEEVKEEKVKDEQKDNNDDLPNLEDKDVQNATLKIQKAYLKKKKGAHSPKKEEEIKTHSKPEHRNYLAGKLEDEDPEEAPNDKKEEKEDELPNLEDKDVQNATLMIQKAYKKKQDKNKAKVLKEKEKKKEEKDDELPNLEDKDVQNATLKIQKAYKKKQDKNKAKAPKEEEEKQKKKEDEEEELLNLEDKDVQNATLMIQKAYKKKQDKNKAKVLREEKEKEEKQKEQEKEDELPNLEDKDVQNATLKIQKAYLKKKKGAHSPKKEEEIKTHSKPEHRNYLAGKLEDEEPEIALNDIKEEKLKIHLNSGKLEDEEPEVVLNNVKEEKSETHLKPGHQNYLAGKLEDEESGLVLNEVNDELDAFEGEKVEDDDDQPYEDKVSEHPKEEKKTGNKVLNDEEDFEPFEEEFSSNEF